MRSVAGKTKVLLDLEGTFCAPVGGWRGVRKTCRDPPGYGVLAVMNGNMDYDIIYLRVYIGRIHVISYKCEVYV